MFDPIFGPATVNLSTRNYYKRWRFEIHQTSLLAVERPTFLVNKLFLVATRFGTEKLPVRTEVILLAEQSGGLLTLQNNRKKKPLYLSINSNI